MSLDVLDVDFSGTTDASGNLTISLGVVSPAYWSVLKCVGQTVGQGQWVISLNSRAVDFGRGPRVNLGPILVQPRDNLAIQIQAAQPGSSVTGKLFGITADNAGEAATHFTPSPSTISVETVAPRQQLPGSPFTVAAGAHPASTTFVLPPNATAVRVLLSAGAFFSSLLGVVGGTTGALYFPASGLPGTVTGLSGPVTVPVDPEFESTIKVDVNNGASVVPVTVSVSAVFLVEAVEVYNQLATPLAVQIPSQPQTPNLFNAATTGGAAVALVTPNGSQHVFLHGWEIESDGGTAGAVLAVLTEHASGKNLAILSSSSQNAMLAGNEGGADLGASSGIDVTLVAGPAGVTVRAAARYRQA